MDAAKPAIDPGDVPQSLVFVDLETTGGNPAHHRITEVGIIRVEAGESIEEWSSLVNPECAIPPYIERFTGISNAMVSGAPLFAEIAATVREKLRGAIFVAHNARFDYSFLRTEFLRAGVLFDSDVMCTVKLSRKLFPQFVRHNLDAVMERHGLHCNARHRALGDARVIRDFWSQVLKDLPHSTIGAAVSQSLLGVVKLPAHLPPGLADELPDGAGVYRYLGEDGVLLYVGRSASLRSQVLAQLGDSRLGSRGQRLADETRRVEWVETHGELGSMLREAEWIRAEKPRYNRRLKGQEESVTLRPQGSGRVEIRRFDELDVRNLAHCFGVFNSAKDARKALTDIASARDLCLKMIGLEESEGSCIARQLGRCKGACVGQEPLMLHAMRTQLALSALKIKSWPFPGRIAIREQRLPRGLNQEVPAAEFHVLDHWAYLGTARSEDEFEDLSVRDASDKFDVDVYRILARHFANHPQLDWQALSDA